MPNYDVSVKQMIIKILRGQVSLEEIKEWEENLSYEDYIKFQQALGLLQLIVKKMRDTNA